MSTLQNFGITGAGGAGGGGILQPKMKNRFRCLVTNLGPITGLLSFTQQVETCSKPHVAFEPVTVDSYNSKAYFAGKAQWETIELVLRDDMTNSVSTLIGAQVQKQMNFFQQTTPAAAVNYKFQMEYDTMDGSANGVVETWNLEGCFIANVNWGEGDYKSAESVTISLTIRFDNATQANGLMTTNPVLTNIGSGSIN